jgi:hypothetical protein
VRNVRVVQSSFVGGEISPKMLGRLELALYSKALAKARNVYIGAQGWVKRREGFAMIEAAEEGRLIEFEFSTIEVYALRFAAGKFRVFRRVAGVWVFQVEVTTSPISALTAAQVQAMQYTQSADVLFLFHPDVQPIRISRVSHTSWTVASIAFTNIPTFDFGSGAEAVMSATRGWPRTGCFYEGRLYLFGLRSRPQTFLASVVGDFFNLNKGTGLDDQGLDVTINDDRVNAIVGCFPGRALQIYTTGGEFTLAGQLGDPVTPSKVATQLKRQTSHGGQGLRVVSSGGNTLFVEAGGKVLRQFVFSDLEQSYVAKSLSTLSEHLLRSPVQMARRKATESFPDEYIYIVNGDGTMAVVNINRDEELLAWSLFETTSA